MKDMSKEQFSAFAALLQTQRWLSDKSDVLTTLWFDDCATPDEQALVSDLISRFKYVSAKEFVEKMNDLVLEIITIPYLDPKETIIAAMASDGGPDSSQALVQNIKVKLQQEGWGEALIVNTFGQTYRKSKEDGFSRKNVILVDEFIGSGRTVIGRVDEINRVFKNNGQDINVFVCVIFSSTVGISAIEAKNIKLYYTESVVRGISDFENEKDIESKMDSMIQIEKRFAEEYGTHKLSECSLGYGKAESLIGIENFNIPNNVFPIFWWGKYGDGNKRKTLFSRYVGAS